MAEAAKKIGGILVVRDSREADRVRRMFSVEATSIQSDESMRGQRKPVLFDPDAVALLCADYESEIAWLKQELASRPGSRCAKEGGR